ncbi:MAG: hypothetical protein ABIO99_09920 [Candidatus Limnocylindria bacterium]
MKRHPADLLSLSFGLFFAAVGLVLMSGGSGALSLAWVGPLVAVVLGGILFWAARSMRPTTDEPTRED